MQDSDKRIPTVEQWEALKDYIDNSGGGGGGGVTILTAADYDWNTSTQTTTDPNSINLWELPAGMYVVAKDTYVAIEWDYRTSDNFTRIYLVGEKYTNWENLPHKMVIRLGGQLSDFPTQYFDLYHGSGWAEGSWTNTRRDEITSQLLKGVMDSENAYAKVLRSWEAADTQSGQAGNLAYMNRYMPDNTGVTDYFVFKGGKQVGDVYKYNWQKIMSVNSVETTTPTTSTIGQIGDVIIDDTTKDAYMCVAVTPQGTDPETYTYTWKKITV